VSQATQCLTASRNDDESLVAGTARGFVERVLKRRAPREAVCDPSLLATSLGRSVIPQQQHFCESFCDLDGFALDEVE